MSIKSLLFSFLLILGAPLAAQEGKRQSVAVCIPAVNVSESSIQALIESGRRHFCRHHDVQYFILSDTPSSLAEGDAQWLFAGNSKPFKLFHALQGHKNIFETYNYLFIIDPKMIFVASVGDEVFGELIAVQKVNSTTQKPVFSSSFYGGRPNAVLSLLKVAYKYTGRADERFYEEMMINRCFKEKPPTRLLSPSYAYPENWELEYPKKIVESRG